MSAPASATRWIWSIVALQVGGLGLGHRLHGDGRTAADRHARRRGSDALRPCSQCRERQPQRTWTAARAGSRCAPRVSAREREQHQHDDQPGRAETSRRIRPSPPLPSCASRSTLTPAARAGSRRSSRCTPSRRPASSLSALRSCAIGVAARELAVGVAIGDHAPSHRPPRAVRPPGAGSAQQRAACVRSLAHRAEG